MDASGTLTKSSVSAGGPRHGVTTGGTTHSNCLDDYSGYGERTPVSERFTMRCAHCGECCTETEMELSDEDVKRLVTLGYNRDAFTVTDQDGVTRLRNVDGRCYFYDPGNARCMTYAARPVGCYIYPVVFSEADGIVIDALCPEGDTVSDAEMRVKGRILLALLDRLDRPSNR